MGINRQKKKKKTQNLRLVFQTNNITTEKHKRFNIHQNPPVMFSRQQTKIESHHKMLVCPNNTF